MGAESYPHIFRPLRLRHLELRNRIFSSGHGTGFGRDGAFGERHVAYHRDRAGADGQSLRTGTGGGKTNAGRGVGTAGIARKWEGERLVRLLPPRPPGHPAGWASGCVHLTGMIYDSPGAEANR